MTSKIAGAVLDGHAWQGNWGTALGTGLPKSAGTLGMNRWVLAPRYELATRTGTTISSANAPTDADMVAQMRAANAAGLDIGLKPLLVGLDDIQDHVTGGGVIAPNTASWTASGTTVTFPGIDASTRIGQRVVSPGIGHWEEIPSGLTANAYGLATPAWTYVGAGSSGTTVNLVNQAGAAVHPTTSNGGNGFLLITDSTAAATLFANYQTTLDHLMDLATRTVASGGAGIPASRILLDLSTEHTWLHMLYDDKWRALIAHLRATWSGVKLTAGAPAVNGYSVVRCWDVLDYIGMTWYRPVQAATGTETQAQIDANWGAYIADLSALSAAWGGKLVLFTELGYRSIDVGPGSNPAGYKPDASSGGTAGQVSQAACFRGFVNTVLQQPWLAGFVLWAWAYPQNANMAGEATSYSITNADGSPKAAALVLQAALASGVTPVLELAPDLVHKTYQPSRLLADVTYRRPFNGPWEPTTIPGVVLAKGDLWDRSTLPAPPPPPVVTTYSPRVLPAFGTYLPDDTTTGIVTPLETHQPMNYPGTADLVITTAGTRITSKEIFGRIVIRAANVIIEDCIIRGTRLWPGGDTALIDCNDNACRGLLVQDSTFAPQMPNSYSNAMIGHGYRSLRNRSFWINDHYGVYSKAGTTYDCLVEIAGCYMTDNVYWQGTVAQYIGQEVGPSTVVTSWGSTVQIPGYPIKPDGTHNDGVQCQGANGGTKSVWIHGNHIRGNDAEQLVPVGQSNAALHPVGWPDLWPQLGTQNCHKRRTYAGSAGTNPSSPMRLADGRYPSNGQSIIIQQNSGAVQNTQQDTVVAEDNWLQDGGYALNLQALAGSWTTCYAIVRNNKISNSIYNFGSVARPSIYPIRADNKAGLLMIGVNPANIGNAWWDSGPYGTAGALLTEGSNTSGIVYDS